jgi:hypothetical protein
MPIDFDKLYQSSGFRSHGDPIYEEQMARLVRDLPQPRILSCADEPRIPFSIPPKHPFMEHVRAWEECVAKGGRPG